MSSGRTLILGAGLSGQSCARYCIAQGIDCVLIEPDASRQPSPTDLNLEQVVGEVPKSLLRQTGLALLSPGLSAQHSAVRAVRAADIPVATDLDWFCAAAQAPVIGITGTNGKSTVVSLLAQMAADASVKAVAGGNLGPAALDLLAERADCYLLEISSFQLEHSAALPLHSAAILNLSPDHLDRHFSMRRYASIKRRIYDRAEQIVCNRDDPQTWPETWQDSRALRFGLGQPASGDYGICDGQLCRGSQALMPVEDSGLRGAAAAANALAALAIGESMGLSLDSMLQTLRGSADEARARMGHRMQLVADRGGVRWIDDSKATNPAAAAAAIAAVAPRDGESNMFRDGKPNVLLIAGGGTKGAFMQILRRAVEKSVRACFLIGADAERLRRELQGAAEIWLCADLAEAVQRADGQAGSGDVVLLSPSADSLDQFADYRDRGRQFAALVQGLAQGKER